MPSSKNVLYGNQTYQKEHNNLSAICYEAIKRKIITCALPPGFLISEKALISELGVSRTPIREALLRLQQERLVEILPKRAIFVSPLSVQDVIDLFVVREILEPFAARLATPHIVQSQLREWQEIYMCLIQNPLEIEEHIDLDRKFHAYIAKMSHNSYLENIIINIYDQNSRIRFLSLRDDPVREREAIKEHLDVIEQFLACSPEGAYEAMKRHITCARAAALKTIQAGI